MLFAAFPINYSPSRSQLFLLCYNDAEFTTKMNLISSITFVAFTCTVAVAYPNVSSVLSIMGGSCSVTICYTIPLYSWVKLSKERWYAFSNLAPLLYMGFLITAGYTSVITTIYMLA